MIMLTKRLDPAHQTTATVTLDLDTRIKSRAQVILDDGREAGIMLPRGHLIRGGELLTDDEGREVVRVIAALESVSTVITDDALLLAKVCYHLGNRHVPLQIAEGWLRYQHDHVLDEMVRGLGVKITAGQAAFEPEAGAYQSAPHSHSHHHH